MNRTKRLTKGILAICLITGMLLASASCAQNQVTGITSEDMENGMFIKLPIRTEEEIAETGVIADDIIAGFNAAIEQVFKNKMLVHGQYAETIANDFSLTLSEISPCQVLAEYKTPYYTYVKAGFFSQVNREYLTEENHIMQEDPIEIDSDMYLIDLNFFYTYHGKVETYAIRDIGVPADTFDHLMKAFEIPSFVVNEETLRPLTGNNDSAIRRLLLMDEEKVVYEQVPITREMLQNANEEQLAILYTAFQEIKAINFDGVVPDRLKVTE